jgi:hypothetical protein
MVVKTFYQAGVPLAKVNGLQSLENDYRVPDVSSLRPFTTVVLEAHLDGIRKELQDVAMAR